MSFEPGPTEEPAVLAAEHEVELRSSELKKELRVIDLVGLQIIGTLGFTWIGMAGKLGSAHMMFWIPAVLLYYVPSGIVVAHLASEMPLEGGLYQWVKLRFGPVYGFIVALNVWSFGVLMNAGLGLLIVGMAPYIFHSDYSGYASNKPLILIASAVGIGSAALVAWRGLSLGKWVSSAGGAPDGVRDWRLDTGGRSALAGGGLPNRADRAFDSGRIAFEPEHPRQDGIRCFVWH